MNKRKEGGRRKKGKKEGFLVREAYYVGLPLGLFEDEKNGIWVVKGGHARGVPAACSRWMTEGERGFEVTFGKLRRSVFTFGPREYWGRGIVRGKSEFVKYVA